MTFTQLPRERANGLINHGPTVLITSKYQDKANIMTAAWCMPVSHNPPMVAVAIWLTRFSHKLIVQKTNNGRTLGTLLTSLTYSFIWLADGVGPPQPYDHSTKRQNLQKDLGSGLHS